MRRLPAILLLTLVASASLVVPAKADHGTYVSHYNYGTTRWYQMEAPTCVEDRMDKVHAAGRSKYISQAVWTINTATAAVVWYRYGTGSCSGTPYKQRIILVDAYYGRTGWLGKVDFGPVCSSTRTYHCIRWGRTPAGHQTWLYTRYVVIPFNLSYGVWQASRHWALHEIGHAMMSIKDRPTWSTGNVTCQSVFAYCAPGNSWTYFVRPDTDINWYNAIRKQ